MLCHRIYGQQQAVWLALQATTRDVAYKLRMPHLRRRQCLETARDQRTVWLVLSNQEALTVNDCVPVVIPTPYELPRGAHVKWFQ